MAGPPASAFPHLPGPPRRPRFRASAPRPHPRPPAPSAAPAATDTLVVPAHPITSRAWSRSRLLARREAARPAAVEDPHAVGIELLLGPQRAQARGRLAERPVGELERARVHGDELPGAEPLEGLDGVCGVHVLRL